MIEPADIAALDAVIHPQQQLGDSQELAEHSTTAVDAHHQCQCCRNLKISPRNTRLNN